MKLLFRFSTFPSYPLFLFGRVMLESLSSAADIRKLTLIMVGAAGGTLIAVTLIYRAAKRYSYWNAPFRRAGLVEELYIYPVKSFRGNQIPWLDCTRRGPVNGRNFDRNFLVVDEWCDHLFLTARVLPVMVTVEARVDDDDLLTLTNADGRSVSVDLAKAVEKNDVRVAKLHRDDKTAGYDCGDEVSRFLTDVLNVSGKRRLRLLYFLDGLYTERNFMTEPDFWNNPVPKLKDEIAYADLASYMATTSSGLADLNDRLTAKGEASVDHLRFRPSIVVDSDAGRPPFDEDFWLHVRVGAEVEFVAYKPCTRCILTTVDPNSGEKHPRMEPLKELRSYRLAPPGKLLEKYKSSPIFGVNMALIRGGRIHVGDEVLVRYKTSRY